jgi:hypothetical protein
VLPLFSIEDFERYQLYLAELRRAVRFLPSPIEHPSGKKMPEEMKLLLALVMWSGYTLFPGKDERTP